MSDHGWATSRETRTLAHYFVEGRSLCGRWTVKSALDLVPDGRASNAVSGNDCAACTKKLGAALVPEDLSLTGDAKAFAELLGVHDIDDEWTKFRAHYSKTGDVFDLWGAWRKWCVNAKHFQNERVHRDMKPGNVLEVFGIGDTVYVEGWFCDGTGELRKDLAVDATNRYIEFVIGDYTSGGVGLSLGKSFENGWCVCIETLSPNHRVAIPWPIRIAERDGSPVAIVECPDTTRITWVETPSVE